MKLHFVSREDYRRKDSEAFLQRLAVQFENPFIIPEGGTSALAIKGVAEMVPEVVKQIGKMPDYFAVAAGTGGTVAGLLSAGANVLAFSALKGGEFLKDDIHSHIKSEHQIGTLQLLTSYHFGGYARWNQQLIGFMNEFKNDFNIQLEQVYTAKMFFGLFDLIQTGHFKKGVMIIAVHTGGLQGLLSE